MGHMKRLFEDTYNEEIIREDYYKKLYIENIKFFEKNGDDLELIGFEKYEDSGMGDDLHQTLRRKR
tara:strand:- start:1376 stop:1573 length:198 start_codon:yes stop_codon:yes gene_type:complete